MINRKKLENQYALEMERFELTHKKSKELHEAAKEHFIDGVPMNWMIRWAGKHPIFCCVCERCAFRGCRWK